MFGSTRQPTVALSQPSRSTRRPNLRATSPPGGNVFAPSAAGKAPIAAPATAAGGPSGYGQRERDHRERDRDREHYQAQQPPQTELTPDQKEEIADAFGLFDLNQDQQIDFHELKVAMKALGFDTPKPELVDILRRYGVLKSGAAPTSNTSPTMLYITFDSFLEIMTQKIAERDPMDEISRAFDLFAGVSGTGRGGGGEPKIGIDDLRRVAKELGENLEEEELQAMIEEFDIDNDGMINRDEFIAICKGD